MGEPRNEKICAIFAVRYATEKRHISHVNARIHTGGEYEPLRSFTKSEILAKLDSGWMVITMTKGGKDYIYSADVTDYTINGKRYIKTVPNDTEEDNLGELPTF